MLDRYLQIVRMRLRSLFRRQSLDKELAKELQLHLQALIAENLARGMTAKNAEEAAKRGMGGLAQIEEECRDLRGTSWWDRLAQDFRYSSRVLLRSPGFVLVAVSSLALGIGANTLMFSVVESLLLRPLPYREPGNLFWITETSPRMPTVVVLPPEYAQWREECRNFDELGAWNGSEFNLVDAAGALDLPGFLVSGNFLNVLGIRPALGPGFQNSHDVSPPNRVVMISNSLWRSRFGADLKIVGKEISLNSSGYRVVGVLPASFRFPDATQPDILVPGGFSAPPSWASPRMALLRIVGRLRRGATAKAAAGELKTVTSRHLSEIPAPYRRAFASRQLQMTPLQQQLSGNLRPTVLMLMGAVVAILLIGCSNLAGLQLARVFARSSEMRIRLALGSSRARIVQLLTAESTLLAGAGGTSGVLIAGALLPAARTLSFLHLASPNDLNLDGTVLFAALLVTAGCALAFGIFPGLSVASGRVGQPQESSFRQVARRNAGWTRSALVAAQVGLASVLLLGAGLLLRSSFKILSNPLGFQPAALLTARFRIDEKRHSSTEQKAAVGNAVLEGIAGLPGVDSASLTSALPLTGYSNASSVVFEGQPVPLPGARPSTNVIAISPGYFRTLQIPLLTGRTFSPLDREGAVHVAIVNQSFARHFYGTSDPIGTRLRWGADGSPWAIVVGIAADVRHRGQDLDPEPELFVPFAQEPSGYLRLAVRTAIPPERIIAGIRGQLREVDRQMPLYDVQTMAERIAVSSERRRLELTTVVGFAGLALLVSLSGLYGVLSYTVTRRTREFGLFMALGSTPSAIAAGVVKQGLLVALAGLIPGLAAAWFTARYFSQSLYKISPHDWMALWTVFGTLLAASALASYFPARRASRVDPARALRWE